jgi:DNA-binding NtrC family response regulator
MLVVDDEVNQRSALASVVARWGYQVETASDGVEALLKLKDFDADVVITDLSMPNMDGKALLEELRKLPAPPPAIVLTAFGNLETALETVHQLGAFWFIEKPLQPLVLKMVVERALDRRRLATHAGRLERELASRGVLGDLIGESAAMQEIFALLQQAAPAKATILITGESGTGKEIVSRSSRANFSATKRALSRERWSGAPGASNWLAAARFCWMKSATCR